MYEDFRRRYRLLSQSLVDHELTSSPAPKRIRFDARTTSAHELLTASYDRLTESIAQRSAVRNIPTLVAATPSRPIRVRLSPPPVPLRPLHLVHRSHSLRRATSSCAHAYVRLRRLPACVPACLSLNSIANQPLSVSNAVAASHPVAPSRVAPSLFLVGPRDFNGKTLTVIVLHL